MEMGQLEESPDKISAGGKTCCVVSEAPAPEAKSWVGSFSVAAAPATVSSVFVTTLSFEISQPHAVNRDSSPPLRSVLCTFLI